MKTKQLLLLLAIPAIIMGTGFFVSCDSDEQEVPAELTLDKTIVPATVTATAKTYHIDVTSNTTWKAEVDAGATGWCSVSPEAGNGNGIITLTIDANTPAGDRDATVTVSAGTKTETISFTQSASSELDIDPSTVTVTASSVTQTIAISTNAAWTAAVTSNSAWCKITSAATGTGAGSITLSIGENTTPASRTAVVTFSVANLQPKTTTITQAASACTPPATFTVTASNTSYCPSDGGATIGLDNSQTGITYTLYKNGSPTTITAAGTGAALDFPGAQPAGSYTVRTVGSQTTCEAVMSGSFTVTELPPFTVGAVTSVAYTRAAVTHMPPLKFSTPAAGVSEYQWLKNGAPIGESNYASFQPNADEGETSLSFKVQVKDACGTTPDAWVDVPGEITLAKVMPACECEPTTVTLTALAPYSDNTKTVGGQVWSDYIKSSSCQVGSFRANVDINSKDVGIVLCRPGDQNQGSLFTWCAIGLFSDQICPTGYHMPSPEEFCDLDKTLFDRGNCNLRNRKDDNYFTDLAKYRTDWGANLSRMCQSNENTDNEPIGLGYMGDWFWSGTRGRSLQLIEGPNESSDNDWVINPNASRDIHNGLSIRCIKN